MPDQYTPAKPYLALYEYILRRARFPLSPAWWRRNTLLDQLQQEWDGLSPTVQDRWSVLDPNSLLEKVPRWSKAYLRELALKGAAQALLMGLYVQIVLVVLTPFTPLAPLFAGVLSGVGWLLTRKACVKWLKKYAISK